MKKFLFFSSFILPFLMFAAEVTTEKRPENFVEMFSPENQMYYIVLFSSLILLCACATKLSDVIKTPCLLIFLGVGMLAGRDIDLNNPAEYNLFGTIALVFILFYGGFSTDWGKVKKTALYGGILSSAGVLMTALLSGLFIYRLAPWLKTPLQLSWCLLLGSIISSTDAAAVFSILRSKSVSLKGNLQSLLELESGSNDPMAAFLTIFMIGIVLEEQKTGIPCGSDAYRAIFKTFGSKMLLGLVLGISWGRAAVWLFNHIDFEYDGLYYVLGFATALLSFGVTEKLMGNGYMSVYVTGIIMGNNKFIYHNSVGRFTEGMAWISQVILFGMLGLVVQPNELWQNYKLGLLAALVLMVIARPFSVFACMIGSKYTWQEKLLIAWVGLRGGAPIMLATYPMIRGVNQSSLMFHIVFFIVITSVILQGMTIMPIAKWLHLDMPLKMIPRVPLEFDYTGNLNGDTREFEIMPGSALINKTLAGLGLPREALVLLIRREGEFLIPHGNTMIKRNDVLIVLGSEKVLGDTEKMLAGPAESNA